ncbi:BNR-4 repeat-containing protein [bacterium]|nr:BNR-4 repeat-containing protein [bacterium]
MRILWLILTFTTILNITTAVTGEPILIDSLGNDKGSAYSMQQRIVSCETNAIRKTHFAYSRVEPGQNFAHWKSMGVWVATYNHQTKAIESRTKVGPIFDNHGTPCLTADAKGYLHIVFGPHHNPFFYRKSKYPNNSTEWESIEAVSFEYGRLPNMASVFDETTMHHGEWTYPIIQVDSSGVIHVGGSLLNAAGYVRKINGRWEQPRKLFTAERAYCRYNLMMTVAGRNVYLLMPDLDISKPDSNRQIQSKGTYYFARSTDGGDSFEDPRSVFSGTIQGNGNCAVSPDGTLAFLSMERNFNQHRWQYLHLWDGQYWQQQRLTIPDRYIWDSSLTFAPDGRLLIFSAANPSLAHWRDSGNTLSLFVGTLDAQGKYQFDIQEIVPAQADKNVWLPTLEARTPAFQLDNFFVMWTREPDLHGNFTSHKNSTLKTQVYAQQLKLSSK